jgi:N-methylhydantoinase B
MADYLRPATLDEAIAIRASRDVEVMSGGTDVYPARVAKASWGAPVRQDVLDISAITELDGIDVTAGAVRLGARATWSRIAESGLPPMFDGLRHAARTIGGAQVQNRGTVAGNLCTASPAGDGIPNLLALDASVELAGPAGRRVLRLPEFLTGYRSTALRSDELVTAVVVQLPADGLEQRSAFLKLGARSYLVISIAMAAGVLLIGPDGRIVSARLAVGACSAVAQRLPAVEAALAGEPAGPGLARLVSPAMLDALSPIDDIRASASYRREAALVLVRDLVEQLAAPPQRRAA